MKQFALLFVALVSMTAFSGCQSVPVDQNGAIPAQASAQLDPVLGTYKGNLVISSSVFGDVKTLDSGFEVQVSRQGNIPHLTSNIDILGPDCKSEIGKLLSLQIGGIWSFSATFEFDPGKCPDRAEGNEVHLYLKLDGSASISLDKDEHPLPGGRRLEFFNYAADLEKLKP